MNTRRVPDEQSQPDPQHAAAGLVVVLVVCLAFFARWFNRYAPPTSNGDVVAMVPWSGDFLPFRDYFYQAPPGMPILVRLVRAITGPRVLGLMVFGLGLRLAGAAALYGILVRFVRVRFAAVATIAAVLLSSTDISDTPLYYNHVGTACVLLGTHAGLAALDRERTAGLVLGAISGACLVFSVAVKQTMIFGVAAASLALLFLAGSRTKREWTRWLSSLVVGGLAVIAGIWAWLSVHQLGSKFLEILRRAPEGKGGVARSLVRPVELLFELRRERSATFMAWALILTIGAVAWWSSRERARGSSFSWTVYPMALWPCVWLGLAIDQWDARTLTLVLTAFGWWGSLALAAMQLPKLLRHELDEGGRARLALGFIGFGVGYCFAVSWPLFENMALPGFAIVVAFMLECAPAPSREQWRGWIHAFVVATAVLAGYRKTVAPHTWGAWLEPPLDSARGAYTNDLLAGVEISEPTARLYAAVEAVAQTKSQPGDRMYVFPNMTILYAIAGRRPATYGLAHWVDTTPDFLGREDARRLRENPPKILVVRRDPLGLVQREEHRYRGGERSSVREVIDALDSIRPLYEQVGSFTSPNTAPIDFFVRLDKPEACGSCAAPADHDR